MGLVVLALAMWGLAAAPNGQYQQQICEI